MSAWPQLLGLSLKGVVAGAWPYAQGDDSVQQTLLHILLTSPGERLMRPEFGAGLLRFVHHPNNETIRRLLAETVRKAVEQWEPRIVLEAVNADADPDDPTLVHLVIVYRLRTAPEPQRFTLDLELEAG